MSDTPEALALATAARLAHANRENWARCAERDPDTNAECDNAIGHDGDHYDPDREWTWLRSPADIQKLTTLAEAQAEWSAAGGDPERGPVLSGTSGDGRLTWRVSDFGVAITVAGFTASRSLHGTRWCSGGEGALADWRECVRLAEAADGGAR